jgi:hypothetical protein
MNAMDGADAIWPDLTYTAWRETLATGGHWISAYVRFRCGVWRRIQT